MKIRHILSTAVAAASLLAVGSASAQASFPDFTVGPFYTGMPTFTADKITGNYVEVITFGAGTFDITLRWNAGQFVANDGVDVLAAGDTNLGNTYGLYALFRGTGTFVAGPTTTFMLDPLGSLNVFLDPGRDTTFMTPANGGSAWGVTQNGADILLASGAAASGSGMLDTNCPTTTINCGSFGQTNEFNLTAAGSNFFTGPVPFYNLVLESGQFNNFTVAGTQVINGSLDVVFNRTPEPTSIALVGLALAGLGFASRRRNGAKV